MTLEARPPSAVPDASLVALADASSDLVCVVSAGERILFLNTAGRAAVGLGDGTLPRNAPLSAYLGADDRALASDCVSDVLRSGRAREETLHFVRVEPGPLVPVACTVVRLAVPSPERCASAAIVGRLTPGPAAAPGRDAGRDAERARLMEMLIGVVGHDLRNPLNAIVTCAHFVAKQSELPGAKALMARIIGSGERMRRMIEQLLDFTRVRAGGIPLSPARVDLATIIEQSVQEIRLAHQGWTVAVEAVGDTTGQWDPDRVAQLTSNLLANAAEHGDRAAGARVRIDGTDSVDVSVTFANAGVIPPDVLPLIFNPFRVVHQRAAGAGGLGLGLYVTRQIALAHGGDVHAESDAGGTRFIVRLPRVPAAGHAVDDADAEIAALERMVARPPNTSVTARLFGAPPLHERAPKQYWDIFERYGRALDHALDRQTYKRVEGDLSEDLRVIAEQLADLGAGAREVAELHTRALRQRIRANSFAKGQAYTAEGRLVSFELMGHLLSAYRRRAGFGPVGERHV